MADNCCGAVARSGCLLLAVPGGSGALAFCAALPQKADIPGRDSMRLAGHSMLDHSLDLALARRMMVDGQIRPNDVTDLRLIAAFLDVPRERFLPPQRAELAYLELDAPVGDGPVAAGSAPRVLLKPMVLAKLIQAANIGPNDTVLDVGAASGYSSAILARLAGAVVSLEEDAALARMAEACLAEGIGRSEPGGAKIAFVRGPLADGWPDRAPYDAILLNGSTDIVPERLCRQLKDGGRLVCILGSGPGSKAMLYLRDGEDISGRPLFDASAPLLPGFSKVPAFAF